MELLKRLISNTSFLKTTSFLFIIAGMCFMSKVLFMLCA